jgi:excisionase family DNA binding protein
MAQPTATDEETHMPATPTIHRSVSSRRGASVPRNDRRLVFTSSQAAGYLGVSLATIRRWTDAGHVSCYRTPGGQRRFTRDQLDGFITSMHRDGATGRQGANGSDAAAPHVKVA